MSFLDFFGDYLLYLGTGFYEYNQSCGFDISVQRFAVYAQALCEGVLPCEQFAHEADVGQPFVLSAGEPEWV